VDGAGRTAGVAAARGTDLMMLVDALNGFFDGLASVMTADGPQGTRPAVLRGTLPLDACAIIADVCGPAGTADSGGTGGTGVPSSPGGRRR
jgi:phospholipid/cholesterol/gamma-HCH transport system substrate-binding protein